MNLPPIDITGDNILKLPAAFKDPPAGDRMLTPVDLKRCPHWNTTFEIDLKGAKCKCLGCNEDVSPMFVLEQLMHKESQWMRTRAAYQDEMKRLAERSSTKCTHCGKMTRVSRRPA
jgi:hypothetical protein